MSGFEIESGTNAPESGQDAWRASEEWHPEAFLEDLGERIVFLDIQNLGELAALHTTFEEFGARAARHPENPELERVSAMATGLITQVILEEHHNPAEALDSLGAMVDYMRRVVRNGKAGEIPREWNAYAGNETTAGTTDGETTYQQHPENPPSAEQPAPADAFSADPELLQEFFEEAREHLGQSEISLLTLESNPEDQEAIAAVFRAFHTVKGAAGLLGVPRIQSLAHVAESLLDKVRQGAIRMEGDVIDLSLEAVDGLKYQVDMHEQGPEQAAESGGTWLDDLLTRIEAATNKTDTPQRLGEILVERGVTSREAVEEAVKVQAAMDPKPMLGTLLTSSGEARVEDTIDALRTQREQRRPTVAKREPIKVDAERLDQLVDLIGELVIAESMVRQADELLDDPMSPVSRRLAQVDKITRELQTISMSLRMVPVRATFQKMTRLVRDLAKKFGKEVEFTTEGDDTELDKNVVDLVADPLMHMVRNAIDHGVESPEDREAQGKSRKSHITLRAYHAGGGVCIDIVDDGRGLDRDAILAKAIDRGLVAPGESLSDEAVWKLIFHPGLSTAKTVTDVSGRGVGMDVVQRNIQALQGSIDVQSAKGKGSTFSIRLPLTLAIIDGMAVKAGDERFVVPIGNVVRATRPGPGDVHTVHGKGEMLRQHDQLIPVFRLHRLMDISNAVEEVEAGIVLILEDNGRQIGVLADDLVGQQQVVIKPLGEGIGSVPGLAGGAIMPDGKVGLILDTAGLFQRSTRAESPQNGALAS